jgi:hypothetical protein
MYRSRHGIQTDGGSVHVTTQYDAELGRMNTSTLNIEALRASAVTPYSNQFRMTSDEPAMITFGGDNLFVDNWERLGGINIQTGELFHVGAVSNDWPECYAQCGPGSSNPVFPLSGNPSDPAYPFPSPRVTEGGPRSGVVIANNMVYWKFIQGGLTGISHSVDGSCPSPNVWTSTPGTPADTPAVLQPQNIENRPLEEYVDLDLTTPAENPPKELVNRIRSQVLDVVEASDHLMPYYLERGFSEKNVWPYNTSNPPGPPEIAYYSDGNLYWHDPGEFLYTMALAYPYLDPELQQDLKSYMNQELQRYPPLENLPWSNQPWLKTGIKREAYDVPFRDELNNWPPPAVNFSAIYSLWLWSKNTGDWTYAQDHWSDVQALFNSRRSRILYYADISGAIGYARLAAHFGDNQAYQDGVQATVTGMQSGRNFNTFQSRAAQDYLDPRGVNSGWSAPVFYGLTPEVGLYLQEQTNGDALSHLSDLEEGNGIRWWYLTRVGVHAEFGETSYLAPTTAWSHFIAHAYIAQEPFDRLSNWLDRPWGLGDLFDIQKLVAAVQAYDGVDGSICIGEIPQHDAHYTNPDL